MVHSHAHSHITRISAWAQLGVHTVASGWQGAQPPGALGEQLALEQVARDCLTTDEGCIRDGETERNLLAIEWKVEIGPIEADSQFHTLGVCDAFAAGRRCTLIGQTDWGRTRPVAQPWGGGSDAVL